MGMTINFTTSDWIIQVAVPIIVGLISTLLSKPFGDIYDKLFRKKPPEGQKNKSYKLPFMIGLLGFIISTPVVFGVIHRPLVIQFAEPQDGQSVQVELLESTGAGMFITSGNSTNAANREDLRIYVLVHPSQPYAGGWWIQKSAACENDGHWRSEVWTGSKEFPPHPGDSFDLIAVIARPKDVAGKLRIDDPLDIRPLAKSSRASIKIGKLTTRPSI